MRSIEKAEVQEDRLTERERELILSAARGLSNIEIADALGISTPTVKATLRRAYHKLGAHSRSDAMIKALSVGHIRIDEIFTEDELVSLFASADPDLIEQIALKARESQDRRAPGRGDPETQPTG